MTAPAARGPARENLPFTTLYRIAQDSGCQMEEQPNVPFNFRGFCPFHEGDSIGDTRTLTLNSRTNKFYCQHCGAQGPPHAFFARMWQTTMHDALQLLRLNPDAGPDRPPYPDPETDANFALLTRASRHYQEAVTAPQAVAFLTALGVDWRAAKRAGIGYAPGDTLYAYLKQQGATEAELRVSPLFENSGREHMAGRLVITDLDLADGARQLGSIHAGLPPRPGLWNNKRPRFKSVRIEGRSYLMGNGRIRANNDLTVLTDDARLYVILRAQGMNAVLLDAQRNPETIAQHLARHQPKRLAVASQQRDLTEDVRRELHKLLPGVQSRRFSRLWAREALNPQTRDLDQLRNFEPQEPRPRPTSDAAAPPPQYRAEPPESPEAADNA